MGVVTLYLYMDTHNRSATAQAVVKSTYRLSLQFTSKVTHTNNARGRNSNVSGPKPV